MSQLIALLIALTSLLSTPGISDSPTVQSQALSIVNQLPALTQEILTVPTTGYLYVQTAPTQSLGTDVGSVEPPVEPSCSITGTVEPSTWALNPNDPTQARVVEFTWDLQGMDPNTTGTIYIEDYNTGGWLLPTINQLSPTTNYAPSYVSEVDNVPTIQDSSSYKAIFGDAVCYAYFKNNSQPFGTVSTSTPY